MYNDFVEKREGKNPRRKEWRQCFHNIKINL